MAHFLKSQYTMSPVQVSIQNTFLEFCMPICSDLLHQCLNDTHLFMLYICTHHLTHIHYYVFTYTRLIHDSIHSLVFAGNTSQKTTLTTLAVTVSCVLAAAVVVGSFLFAVTMWRIRSQGRTQNNTGSISHRSEMSTGSCVLCLCRCARRDTTCSAGRMGRDGFHLHTIEAKDKNRRPVPLHLPDRHSRSSELDAGNTSHPAKGKNDDLPYGYISPAEINVPKFRKFTVSEERPQQTQQKQTPATKLPNAYTNVVCGRVSDQPVYRQETSSQNTVSLQDSVDSTSCTTNIEGNYLEIMPP